MMTTISSACGAVKNYRIDTFDAALSPHGIACCGNCECIITARESWAIAFNYQF